MTGEQKPGTIEDVPAKPTAPLPPKQLKRIGHQVSQVTVSQVIDQFDDGSALIEFWGPDGKRIGHRVLPPKGESEE